MEMQVLFNMMWGEDVKNKSRGGGSILKYPVSHQSLPLGAKQPLLHQRAHQEGA